MASRHLRVFVGPLYVEREERRNGRKTEVESPMVLKPCSVGPPSLHVEKASESLPGCEAAVSRFYLQVEPGYGNGCPETVWVWSRVS